MVQRAFKHQFGQPNPVIQHEERELLAGLDRALGSSPNSQTIGRNGEVPVRRFFARYLPYMLRAETGHFITPSGAMSPQIDVLILDSRYPLLAENADGSVLAMLHAVVATIEVKTRITPSDVAEIWNNAVEVMDLAREIDTYGNLDDVQSLATYGLAYRSAVRLDTLGRAFVTHGQPVKAALDLYLLRLPDNDQPTGEQIGTNFWFEPLDDTGEIRRSQVELSPGSLDKHTPLSDLYYRLLQNAFYTLAERNWTFDDLGHHLMEYMTWSTYRTLLPRAPVG